MAAGIMAFMTHLTWMKLDNLDRFGASLMPMEAGEMLRVRCTTNVDHCSRRPYLE